MHQLHNVPAAYYFFRFFFFLRRCGFWPVAATQTAQGDLGLPVLRFCALTFRTHRINFFGS